MADRQAGLGGMDMGTPVGPSRAAGLNEPQTMEDQQLDRVSLLRQGYSPNDIDQLLGIQQLPEDTAVAEADDEMGFLDLFGYGLQRGGRDAAEGMSGMAEDWIGKGRISDGLDSAGEWVGPSEERDAARARRAEGRGIIGSSIDAMAEEAGALAGMIGVGAGVGTATATPGAGTVVGGGLGALYGVTRMYDQGRDSILEGKRQAKAAETGRDPTTISDDELGDLTTDEKARTAMTGALGLVDAFPGTRVLRAIAPQKVAQITAKKLLSKGGARMAGKEALETGLIEGTIEVAQELGAMALTDEELRGQIKAMEKPQIMEIAQLIAQTQGENLAVSFLAGMGLGGVAGGVSGSIEAVRQKRDITTLGAIAESHGVTFGSLEEVAKDPEKASQMTVGIREVLGAQQIRDTAERAYNEAAPEDKEMAGAILESYDQKLSQVIDDKFGELGIEGFQSSADIKKRNDQLDAEQRSAAIEKLGANVPVQASAPTKVVSEVADDLDTARADRLSALQTVQNLQNASPKRLKKAQDKLAEATEAEATVRERVATELQGRDPLVARKEFLDSVNEKAEITRQRSEGAAETAKAEAAEAKRIETREKRVMSAARLKGIDEDVPLDLRRERARRIKNNATKLKRKSDEKTNAEIGKLRRKLDTLPEGPEFDRTVERLDDLASRKDQVPPAVEAAERVLQDEAQELSAQSQELRPEADTEAAPSGGNVDTVEGVTESVTPTDQSQVKVVPDDTQIVGEEEVPTAAGKDLDLVDMEAPLKEETPEAYFDMTEDSEVLPIDKLRPVRARPEGIENAGKFMRAAAEGRTDRRKPISVERQDDGTYKIRDGNSTFANMQAAGWKNVPVRVVTPEQFASESVDKFAKKTGTEATVEGDTIVAKGRVSQRAAAEKRAAKEGVPLRYEPTDAFPEGRRSVGRGNGKQYPWSDKSMARVGQDTTIEEIEQDMRDLPEADRKYEHSASFDENGKLIEYGTIGDSNAVTVPDEKNAVTMTHLHPASKVSEGDTPFSMSDVVLFSRLPKLQTVRAVLQKTGEAIEMTATPEVKAMTPQELVDATADQMDAAARELAHLPQGLSAQQLARLQQEINLRLLDQMGLIDYNTGVEFSVEEEEMINDAIDAADRAGSGEELRGDVGAPAPQAGPNGSVGGTGAEVPAGVQGRAPQGEAPATAAAVNQLTPDIHAAEIAEKEWQAQNMASRPDWASNQAAVAETDPRLERYIEDITGITGVQGRKVPPKGYDRATEKAIDKARGGPTNYGRLGDLTRGTFTPMTAEEGDRVVRAMIADPRFDVLDEGWNVIPDTHYTDRKVTLRDVENGMLAEIQLVEPSMYNAKENLGGHDLYGRQRSLPEGSREWQDLNTQMRELYDAALDAADPSLQALVDRGPAMARAMDDTGRISVRFPKLKSSPEDPLVDVMQVDTDAMKATPASFDFNMETVRSYDAWSHGDMSPDETAEQFKKDVTANLLYLHDQFDDDTRLATSRWYDGARKIVSDWSGRYGVSTEEVAGVIASLSPQKDWFTNLSLAERILDIAQFAGNEVWSPKMTAEAKRIYGKPQYADSIKAISGKRLNDLTDPVDKAMWIRTYDEANNPRGFRSATTDGNWIGEPSGKVSWGSNVEIAKAVKILDNPTVENISQQMGGNHKVRSFYNNIISPMSGDGDVTIDTHAVAAAHLSPYSGFDQEVAHNFGVGLERKKQPENYRPPRSSGVTGAKGLYGLYADAYRDAAAQRDILPRQMQSITWEAVRTLFTPGWKRNKKNVGAVRDIWKRHAQGDIDADTARREITDFAGGVSVPDWVRSTSGQDAERRSSSYESGVPEASLRVSNGGAGSGPRSIATRTPPAGVRALAAGVDAGSPDAGAGLGGRGPGQDQSNGSSDGSPVRDNGGLAPGQSRPAEAVEFKAAMDAALAAMGPEAAQVNRPPEGADLYLMGDGSGYAISDGDNIGAVFAGPNAPRGAAQRILDAALDSGGRRLDGFDTYLPAIYAKGGFRAVARLPFDPQYAPSVEDGALGDWDADAMERMGVDARGTPGWGSPDVVFMVYDPQQASADTDNVVDNYDDGVAAQQNTVPLYVNRPVVEGAEAINQWAKDQGFKGVLGPRAMHTTILYSKNAMDKQAVPPLENTVAGTVSGSPIRQLGNALALKVNSPTLKAAHKRYMDAGGSHDWADYTPHVTFKYNPTDADLELAKKAKPFKGKVKYGPEEQDQIDTDRQRPALARGYDPSRDGTFEKARTPLMGNKENIWLGKLHDTRQPVDAFNKWRHEWTDYDTDSVFANILDRGLNGGQYQNIVKDIEKRALAEIDHLPLTSIARKAAMSAHVEQWAKRKLGQRPVEFLKPAHVEGTYQRMGKLLENGQLDERRIMSELSVPRDKANRISALARKKYLERRPVARGVEVPAYMKGPKAPFSAREATQNAINAARDPMGKAGRFGQWVERELVNRFSPIRDMEVATKGHVGAGFDSAFKTAEMAVNDSGRNEALMFYGAADWADFDPKNPSAAVGYKVKEGTIGIRKMLDKLGDAGGGQKLQDFQEFMAARRAKDLHARGIKTPLSEQNITDGLAKGDDIIREVAGDWKKFNDANIDFLVKTGRVSKRLANVLKADAAYVPFYRTDERVDGSPELFPNLNEALKYSPGMVSGNITSGRDPGIKKIKGGEVMKLDSIIDNMISNSQAMIAAGMRNKAANKSFDMLEDAGMVRTTKSTKGGKALAKPTRNAIKMWKDGKEKWVVPTDPAAEPVLVALSGLDPLRLEGIMKGMAQIGSIFRQGITLAPSFIVRNMIRGTVATGVLTSGANLTARNNVFTGALDSLRRGAGKQTFSATSGMGDFRFGGHDVGFGKDDWMIDYGLADPGMFKKSMYRIRKAIDVVEDVGTATELGDRIAAMNSLVESGMRPDEAAYQALTIVNYGRQGSNKVLRQMLPLIPFLNARIQGLARLAEGAVGKGSTPLTRKQAMMQIALNGALLGVASGALWAWNNADDERREKYENEPLHRRLNYHIMYVGDKKVLIPKAFEIGVLFSTLPEMAGEMISGDTEELGEAFRQTLMNTFSFNPVPAALLPAMEVVANYNAFTGREITGMRLQNRAERDQYESYTPYLARMLAQNGLADWAGASPLEIDHLLNGYGGAPYKFFAAALDTVASDLGLMESKPEGVFGTVPVASAALQKTFGSMVKDAEADASERWLGDFYDMKRYITQIHQSAKDARQDGDTDRFNEIITQAPGGEAGTAKAYKTVNKYGRAIGKLNTAIRTIRNDAKMTPAKKRDELIPLLKQRNKLAREAYEGVRAFEDALGSRFSKVS